MRELLWKSNLGGWARAIQSDVYLADKLAGGVHQKSPGFGAGAVKMIIAYLRVSKLICLIDISIYDDRLSNKP